jgi:hypothetical protein
MRRCTSILGMFVLATQAQFAEASVTVVDLTTTNLKSSGIIVQSQRVEGSGRRFRVIVTPRDEARPSDCAGRLWIRDGKKEVVSCDVASRKLPKESKEVEDAVKEDSVVFEFEVAGGYVINSEFTLTWTASRGISSAFSFRLRLKDFSDGKDHAIRHELPLFGELPTLDERWIRQDVGTNRAPRSSWIIFSNSQNGDMLSFAADEIARKVRKVDRVPWSDMAGSIFSGGYPVWNKPAGENFAVYFIRNEVVQLSTGDGGGRNIEQEALEYSMIYEQKPGTNRLAHGYALAFGGLRVFVQHTSTKAVTPELAQEMASRLMFLHSRRKVAD